MIYLDTHIVVWLHAGRLDMFSDKAELLLENEDLFISPIVQLELQYLREIERIRTDSALILETLRYSVGLDLCPLPFASVIVESLRQTWTRDPFDRLIVAQSIAGNAQLLTKDRMIHQHFSEAVWE
jgi:PIN domain nuclease of toxin-antitoxin system